MASFFQKIKVKKDNQLAAKNLVKTAEKKATLPDDFFEQILTCEIQLKKGFSMNTLRKLINLYSKAVEFFESINDPRYHRYSKSLQLLLMQPQIVKQINMLTAKGKIKVHKQERKKEILDEFKNLDKKFISETNVKDIINKTNKEEKKKNFDQEKDKDINTQTDNFKKRLAEKKKKWIMNTSDIGQSSNLQSKNLVVFNPKKHLNKSFDAIGQDEPIFSGDISIEPISMYNAGENSLNINEGINNNITKIFINKIVEINKEKLEEKVKTAKEFAEKIKDKEFKLSFDNVNMTQEERDKIGKEILELGEEQNKKYEEIDKKYEEKINEVKDSLKKNPIQNMEWIRNLREKYTLDIDSTIYNFIGN